MAGKLKKLSPTQAQEAVAMYQSGMSLAVVAGNFGVSRQAMWDLIRRRTQLRPQQRHGADNHFYRGGKSADDQAHNQLETAIEQGLIKRQSVCKRCGDSGQMRDGRNKVQAHHSDYNKPLDVLWLCQKCHHAWHQSNVPIRRILDAERQVSR